MTSKKSKTNATGNESKKTTFAMDEYDNLILDLDLIIATLQASIDHDSNIFDISPIVSEALTRATNIKDLMSSMHPVEVTQ